MDIEELNEAATLLHIVSEIAQNHPNMDGIKRACQRRLAEINAEKLADEAKAVEANKQEEAKQAAKDYKPPTDGSQTQVEKPKMPVVDAGEVERRV